MDREEILKMEAGREMDELAMERVMKWERQPVKIECYEYFKDEKEGIRYIRNDVMPGLCWSPSRRIKDAWEVVEKLKTLGFMVEVETQPGCDFSMSILREKEPDSWIIVNFALAPTAPLAICRAALLAVMP